MRVLLDTNVVLDVLLAREPFVDTAREIFGLVESGEIEGYLCATTITTLHYLVGKAVNRGEADTVIAMLLKLFEVAPVGKQVLTVASESDSVDYEDSVIFTAADFARADMIVTRDRKGFKKSKITIMEPRDFLAFWRTGANIWQSDPA